jgi:hypothetical protein
MRGAAHGPANANPVTTRGYPVSWTLLDKNGVETNTSKFSVSQGDSLDLILRIANRGEAEEFRLGGASIGVFGNLPGSLRLAPGTELDVPIKLVKPNCNERKGTINLNLYPVGTKERYRSIFKRIVLECG